MLRKIPTSRWRWYILATLVVVTYPIVVSLTIIGTSFSYLLEGTQELQHGQALLVHQPDDAALSFADAGRTLDKGVTILQQAPWFTKLITPLPPFRWQVQLTKASHALAESGKITTSLRASFPELPKSTDPSVLLSGTSNQFFQWYGANQSALDHLQTELTAANQELRAVPNWVVPGHSKELYSLKENVRSLAEALPQVRTLITETEKTLGAGTVTPQTILVLFQNNSELRMSGGFFGSYATLTASSGRIRTYAFGQNIYKLDQPFTDRTKKQPPAQLAALSKVWGFRDSNVGAPGFLDEYSPQIKQFYEEASGQTITGIIYVNLSLLESLVSLTGPITLPGTASEVTAETISPTLTQHIEKDYFNDEKNKQENEPKSILNDLLPLIISKLQNQPDISAKLLPTLQERVLAKDIQFWAPRVGLHTSLTHFLPTDAPSNGNWIKVVNNNLGGLKSSRFVEQHVAIKEARNFFSNSLEQTVRITRTHTGTGAWPDGENKNYVEIYLPRDADIVLLPEGREALVTTADTWKRISFWATTSVGESTAYTIRYTLPLRSIFTEKFTYLKQAGSTRETLELQDQSYPVRENIELPFR